MIKNNIEISFGIKIDRVSFSYIMEYENQDLELIEHCNIFENQLNYFFYSYEKDKFVNKKGKEIKIKRFLKDIKPLKNYMICMPQNKGRDLEAIKNIIDNIPSDMQLNENNLLGKKKYREEINKDYGNFMEIYTKNEKRILTLSSKEKNHDEILKKNRITFFSYYTDILDKSKNSQKEKISACKKDKRRNDEKKEIKNKTIKITKKEDNEKMTEQANKIIVDNQDKKNDESDSMNAKNIIDNYLNDIISYNKDKSRYDFTQEYNKMLIDFFKINTENKIYSSLFNNITEINILANPLEFPFYYLIINKSDITDKFIIYKKQEIFEVYDFKNKRNKTSEEFKILFISMIQNEFYENHYVIVCAFSDS